MGSGKIDDDNRCDQLSKSLKLGALKLQVFLTTVDIATFPIN